MFTQYFGNFLFESGVITREQFRNSLEQVPTRRAKLGVLAMESDLMTPEQIEEIHGIQLHVDKKFGELAVENHFLTAEQLDKLLTEQPSPFSVFSQIMCDEGYLTYAQLLEMMESYREKCGMSVESFAQFKSDDTKPIIDKLLIDMAGDERRKLIVSSYLEIFVKNVLRFISPDVMLGEIKTSDFMRGDWISCQKISGSYDMTTSFAAGEAAMLCFASAFAKNEFSTFDIMARDIAGEFLNCNNGIFTLNMIEHGLDLGMEPQIVSNDVMMGRSDDMLSIALTVDQHSYALYLAF